MDSILLNNALANQASALSWKAEAERISREAVKIAETLNTTRETYVGCLATMAGLRTVIRELLAELRSVDPKNPLLQKAVRDRVFDHGQANHNKRVTGLSFSQLDDKLPELRDAVFGIVGSNKSGPELDKIAPNLQVRVDADVPFHAGERDKFLRLIAHLAAEVQQTNPASPVLREKELVDLFETGALHELLKLDRNPNL